VSKLTPQQQQIVDRVEAGNFRETACASAGVSTSTLRAWLRKGAKGKQPFKSFSEALDMAEANSEVAVAEKLAEMAENNLQAAVAFLERRFRERWGKQDADAAKDMVRLLDAIQETVPMKTYFRIMRVWDNRSTIEDGG
jgi:transposase-like protein